ncbi:MAG TPA: hypothetical protein VHH73_16235, partial [Verrucomicrobiae bacterium]|nr:hypothetical protein [Verrucomicrobiae bacterium]
MKIVWLSTVMGMAMGCGGPAKVSGMVPAGRIATGGPLKVGEGSLVVLSAWDCFDTFDPEHKKHTPYEILGENGVVIQRVENRAGAFGSEPVMVRLAAGTYRLRVLAAHSGMMTLPVVIREHRVT